MTNIQNIHKDMVWLSWLFHYRLDFFQYQQYGDVNTFFANCKQQTEEDLQKFFYRPPKFSLTKPFLEVQAKAYKSSNLDNKLSTLVGVPVFVGNDENELPDLDQLKKEEFVMLAKEPFTLLEINKHWAKVDGYFYQRNID